MNITSLSVQFQVSIAFFQVVLKHFLQKKNGVGRHETISTNIKRQFVSHHHLSSLLSQYHPMSSTFSFVNKDNPKAETGQLLYQFNCRSESQNCIKASADITANQINSTCNSNYNSTMSKLLVRTPTTSNFYSILKNGDFKINFHVKEHWVFLKISIFVR